MIVLPSSQLEPLHPEEHVHVFGDVHRPFKQLGHHAIGYY